MMQMDRLPPIDSTGSQATTTPDSSSADRIPAPETRSIELKLLSEMLQFMIQGADLFCIYHEEWAHVVVAMQSATRSGEPRAETAAKSLAPPNVIVALKEEREIVEFCVSILGMLPNPMMREFMDINLPGLIEAVCGNKHLLAIVQALSGAPNKCATFADMLVKHLLGLLDHLGTYDRLKQAALVRLFRYAFQSVALREDAAEAYATTHMLEIVRTLVHYADSSVDPVPYLHVLRGLFRSYCNGRYEHLHKDFLPYTPVFLDTMYRRALESDAALRDVYCDLALNVPVKLSSLVTWLSHYMRTLILGLKCRSTDILFLSLKMTDLLLDNLTADFLDLSFLPFIDDLMAALASNLRLHAHDTNQIVVSTTIKVIGKLGARSRCASILAQDLGFQSAIGHSTFSIKLNFGKKGNNLAIKLPLNEFIRQTVKIYEDFTMTAGSSHTESSVSAHEQEAFTSLIVEVTKNLLDVADHPSLFVDYRKLLSVENSMITSPKPRMNETRVADYLNFLECCLIPLFIASDRHQREQFDVLLDRASEVLATFIWRTSSSIRSGPISTIFGAKNAVDCVANLIIASLVFDKRQQQSFSTSNPPQNRSALCERVCNFLSRLFKDVLSTSRRYASLDSDLLTSATTQKEELIDTIPLSDLYEHLSSRLVNCLFDKDPLRKRAGCLGLDVLIDLLVEKKLTLPNPLPLIRGVLFVLKDISYKKYEELANMARRLLFHVLELSLNVSDGFGGRRIITGEEPLDRNTVNMLSVFITELCGPGRFSRQVAGEAIETVLKLLGKQRHDLMEIYRSKLLAMMITKPFKWQNVPTLTGLFMGMHHCLSVTPPIVSLSDSMRNLNEMVLQVKADDQTLWSRHPHLTPEEIAEFRAAGVRCAIAALRLWDLKIQGFDELRNELFGLVYRSLSSSSKEIILEVENFLGEVTSDKTRFPREVIHASLRTVLLTISDHRRMSVSALQGFHRLLQHYQGLFTPGMSERLYEFVKKTTDPSRLATTLADGGGKEGEDLHVCYAILDLCHLLPTPLQPSIDLLVTATLHVENALQRQLGSSMRPGLLKYICRYTEESLQYFIERLDRYNVANLFLDLFRDSSATVFRQALLHSKYLNPLVDIIETPEMGFRFYFAIRLLDELMSREADLSQNRLVISCLHHAWFSRTRAFSHLSHDLGVKSIVYGAFESLARCVMLVVDTTIGDCEMILDIFREVTTRPLIDGHDIRAGIIKFFEFHDLNYKKLIFKAFLGKLQDAEFLPDSVLISRYIIVGLLNEITRDQKTRSFFDTSIITNMDEAIWTRFSDDMDVRSSDLITEFLKWTRFILEHAPECLGNHTKSVSQFAISHAQRHPDIHVRYLAAIVLAHFTVHFDIGPELLVSLLQTLLKLEHLEVKPLARMALDILIPSLPKRAAILPNWPGLFRTCLIEVTNDLPFLVHIWETIFRHADVFFEHRSLFVPLMIPALSRIGLHLQMVASEGRRLIFSIVDSILVWEKKRLMIKERNVTPSFLSQVGNAEGPVPKTSLSLMTGDYTTTVKKIASPSESDRAGLTQSMKEMRMEVDHDTIAEPLVTDAGERDYYRPPTTLIDHIIFAMCKSMISSHEYPGRSAVVARFLRVLEDLLRPHMWPDANLRLDYFDRLLDTTDFGNPLYAAAIVMWLEIVLLFVERKPGSFVVSAFPALHKLLNSCLFQEHAAVAAVSARIYASLLRHVFPSEEDPKFRELWDFFLNSMEERAMEGLSQGHSPVACLNVAKVTASAALDRVNRFIPSMIKHALRLIKDYSAAPAASTTTGAPLTASGGTTTAPPGKHSSHHTTPSGLASIGHDFVNKQLSIIIDIIRHRLSLLGDNKKPFMALLQGIFEKCTDSNLLLLALDISRTLILKKDDTLPTLKEKAALCAKMIAVDRPNADEKLLSAYFGLLLSIFSDPSFSRTEVVMRLEPGFLAGLYHGKLGTHQAFFNVLDQSISTTPYHRLSYIFGIQNWNAYSQDIWVVQALNLLLSSNCLSDIETGSPREKSSHNVSHSLSSSSSYYEESRNTLVLAHVPEFVTHMKTVCSYHLELASSLWVSLFCSIFKQLAPKERHDLTKVLVLLLAREFLVNKNSPSSNIDSSVGVGTGVSNNSIAGSTTALPQRSANIIHIVMESIARIVPWIQIPPYLIKYIGSTYGLWYLALQILHGYLEDDESLPNEDLAEIVRHQEEIQYAIADLYELLSETDCALAMYRHQALFPELNSILSYEQIGDWTTAFSDLEALQLRARSGAMIFAESDFHMSEQEMIRCAKKLQLWSTLAEYGKTDGRQDLVAETCWKLGDWTAEQEALHLLQSMPMEDFKLSYHLYQAYTILMQTGLGGSDQQGGGIRLSEALKWHDQAVHRIVKEFLLLPSTSPSCTSRTMAHSSLFVKCQLVLELHEGCQMLQTMLSAASVGKTVTPQEFRQGFAPWRERMPSLWEDIDVWSNVFYWRQRMLKTVHSMLQNLIPPQQPSSMLDSVNKEFAFSGNRYAKAARKHRLYDVCILTLNELMQLSNIEIGEAFFKVREHLKCSRKRAPGSTGASGAAEMMAANGLDIIQGANLTYFNQSQKAEIYHLRAEIVADQGHLDEAFSSFSIAAQMSPENPRIWSSWGRFCEALLREHPGEIHHGVNAINCFLQACALDRTSSKPKRWLAHVLWLLHFDDKQQSMAKCLETHMELISPSHWLPLISLLIGQSFRPEGLQIRSILVKMARVYPQALYPLLKIPAHESKERRERELTTLKKEPTTATTTDANVGKPKEAATTTTPTTFVMDDLESRESAGSTTIPSSTPKSATSPAPHPEASSQQSGPYPILDVHSFIKRSHGAMTMMFDAIADDIQRYVRATNEENMDRFFNALLRDGAVQAVRAFFDPQVTDIDDLPAVIKLHLQKLIRSSPELGERVRRELNEPGMSMIDKLHVIRRYKDYCRAVVGSFSKQLPLELVARNAAEYHCTHSDELDMYGYYLGGKDVNMPVVKIDRFLPHVDISSNTAMGPRRLSIRGTDGRIYRFAVNGHVRGAHHDERFVQLLRMFNLILEKHVETRRRNLTFYTPVIVPLSHTVRLIEDDINVIPLEEIHEHTLLRTLHHPDEPLFESLQEMYKTARELRAADSSVQKSSKDDQDPTVIPAPSAVSWRSTASAAAATVIDRISRELVPPTSMTEVSLLIPNPSAVMMAKPFVLMSLSRLISFYL